MVQSYFDNQLPNQLENHSLTFVNNNLQKKSQDYIKPLTKIPAICLAVTASIGICLGYNQAAVGLLPYFVNQITSNVSDRKKSLTLIENYEIKQQEQEQKFQELVETSQQKSMTLLNLIKQEVQDLAKQVDKQNQSKHFSLLASKIRQIQGAIKAWEIRNAKITTTDLNAIQQDISNLQFTVKNLVETNNKVIEIPDKPQIKSRKQKKNITIFVDGDNLKISAKEAGIYRLNYQELWNKVTPTETKFTVYFYTAIHPDSIKEQKFLNYLKSFGINIITKEILKRLDGSIKGNLDIELSNQMLLWALNDNDDETILISGDGDFLDTIKRVKQLGKKVTVASFEQNTSHNLIKIADNYINLNEYRQDIEYASR